jgi:SAM-dependent methyltransferase
VTGACPSCGQPGMATFYEQEDVPSHSVLLLPTREEAVAYPRGTIRLAHCGACGFVANLAVDPALRRYSGECEETQSFSPRFREFAERLARDLVERHGIRDRSVVEIGCGKAEFLATLCELGGNRGVGIDPAAVPERLGPAASRRVRLIREYFSEDHFDLPADVVVCRHTLEHIPDTAAFMGRVRRFVAGRGEVLLFFELPDALRVLREAAFWDIYYEHCSYFTPGSLARLFRSTGFRVERLELAYDDQYILLEARAGEAGRDEPLPLEEPAASVAGEVRAFTERLDLVRSGWRARLDSLAAEGRRVAVWGSGSKAVAFLSTLGGERVVERVVDVNPHRHGRYMPGSGREISAPESLREDPPDVVIAMNPVYREEIAADLRRLGVRAELLAL